MIDADATLAVAVELLARGEEASLRAAIGRAYYAAGYCAIDIALASGMMADRPNLHAVWGRFRALRGQERWSAVGADGQRLKDFRLLADYEPTYPGDLHISAASAVALARELIARMEALPAPRTGGTP